MGAMGWTFVVVGVLLLFVAWPLGLLLLVIGIMMILNNNRASRTELMQMRMLAELQLQREALERERGGPAAAMVPTTEPPLAPSPPPAIPAIRKAEAPPSQPIWLYVLVGFGLLVGLGAVLQPAGPPRGAWPGSVAQGIEISVTSWRFNEQAKQYEVDLSISNRGTYAVQPLSLSCLFYDGNGRTLSAHTTTMQRLFSVGSSMREPAMLIGPGSPRTTAIRCIPAGAAVN